jgi:wyosine [tRNA(Phe)-imidazoG37] synthetase (radical SAM superfamily)
VSTSRSVEALGSHAPARRAPVVLPRWWSLRPPGAVIYGPLLSRRLGRSLGINLMRPGRTVCSFRCVYCETPRRQCPRPSDSWAFADWPTALDVARALALALPGCGPLDSITISGTGEPTEHPDFEAVADSVLRVARRLRRGVPVRILTNGANTVRPTVRRALDRLDERIVIVDADPQHVDRPDPRSPLGGIVQGVSRLRDFTAQSCFVGGAVPNVGEEAVSRWIELLDEMRPRSVQIFTISRRPAQGGARPVSTERLHEIAHALRRRTGIESRVFA